MNFQAQVVPRIFEKSAATHSRKIFESMDKLKRLLFRCAGCNAPLWKRYKNGRHRNVSGNRHSGKDELHTCESVSDEELKRFRAYASIKPRQQKPVST